MLTHASGLINKIIFLHQWLPVVCQGKKVACSHHVFISTCSALASNKSVEIYLLPVLSPPSASDVDDGWGHPNHDSARCTVLQDLVQTAAGGSVSGDSQSSRLGTGGVPPYWRFIKIKDNKYNEKTSQETKKIKKITHKLVAID